MQLHARVKLRRRRQRNLDVILRVLECFGLCAHPGGEVLGLSMTVGKPSLPERLELLQLLHAVGLAT